MCLDTKCTSHTVHAMVRIHHDLSAVMHTARLVGEVQRLGQKRSCMLLDKRNMNISVNKYDQKSRRGGQTHSLNERKSNLQ